MFMNLLLKLINHFGMKLMKEKQKEKLLMVNYQQNKIY